MIDIRDRSTFLLLKKNKSRAERMELRHYLSTGIYKSRKPVNPLEYRFQETVFQHSGK